MSPGVDSLRHDDVGAMDDGFARRGDGADLDHDLDLGVPARLRRRLSQGPDHVPDGPGLVRPRREEPYGGGPVRRQDRDRGLGEVGDGRGVGDEADAQRQDVLAVALAAAAALHVREQTAGLAELLVKLLEGCAAGGEVTAALDEAYCREIGLVSPVCNRSAGGLGTTNLDRRLCSLRTLGSHS